MVEWLMEIGSFLAQAVIIVVAISGLSFLIISMGLQVSEQRRHRPSFELENLSNRLDQVELDMQRVLMQKKEWKVFAKNREKERANVKKQLEQEKRPRLFVLKFEGDIRASQVEQLTREINGVLLVAKPGDEVLCRIDSAGGLVTTYGLGASQLLRIREAGIQLTVAIDEIAASGGYLMACVADKILCAPFAVVGSIGVVAQIPNFHRLLKRNEIDYFEITAGQYKRTVSFLGEIKDDGMAKFREQVEETHQHFREFLAQFRPNLKLDEVSTGEHWDGDRALKLGLVDQIITSDAYLLAARKSHGLFALTRPESNRLLDRIRVSAESGLKDIATSVISQLQRLRFGL